MTENTAPSTDLDLSRPPADIALPHAASAAAYVGQATAIEQSRAAAEVQAAVVLAHRMPRSIPVAIQRMRETCAVGELAEQAFFRYSRGGGQITGESVHLARELARCWGNLQYGITELERDSANRQSVMLAFCWDLETNTRSTTTFIVPWVRDKQGKTEASPLSSVRDQYENNANMGARRVREQIFAVLPKWFTTQAAAACRHTIEHGSTEPLALRVSKAVAAFDTLGVHVDQLGTKLGRQAGQWGTGDVATLTVIFKSIKAGETSVEDEFPPADRKVTVTELAAHRETVGPQQTRKPAGKAKPAEQVVPADDGEQGMRPDDPDLAK